MITKFRVLLVLSTLLFCLHAAAQLTLGAINGNVTDRSSAVIPGATVTITDLSTGFTRTSNSGSSGSFSFTDLPIGTYQITVTKEGFNTSQDKRILVQANRTATFNLQLAPGSVNTTVEVTATPLLNQTDTTNGYVLDSQQIEQTPLGTGSFTQLAILAPGVNAELLNSTGSNSGLGNQPIWANGQRDTSNSFNVNGVDSTNLFNGKSSSQLTSERLVFNTGQNFLSGGTIQTNTSVYAAIGQALPTPAPETIQELRVNTSMYDATQGAYSGAHVDLSTKSGSNNYHGEIYGSRQSDALNADNFFYKRSGIPTPPLHRFTAGATLGGPVIHDKLFFFLGWQAVRVRDQLNGISQLTTAPGLTDDRSPAALASVGNQYLVAAGSNPTLTPGALDPAAINILQFKLPNGQYLIPSAGPSNGSGSNAFQTATDTFSADQGTAALDYNLSSKDTLALKYYYQHDPTTSPFASAPVLGFAQALDAGAQVGTISNTRTITDHLVWDQRIGFDRMKAFATNQQAINNSQAGINLFGIQKFPNLSIGNIGTIDGTPGSLGLGPHGNFSNEGMFQTRYTPSTNINWILGNHQLSFGAQYEFTQLNVINRANEVATLAFNTLPDFLTGTLNNSGSSLLQGQSNRYYRAQQVGSYAQDKWQIRPNLTLTLGVRYDWDGPLTEKYGNLFNFDPSRYQYDAASDTIVNDGFVVAGNNKFFPTRGVSNSTLKGRQWGIGPRIGIAYSPFKNLVFRTGFGVYYDRGEYFTYLSPGAGSGISGPFGVTQEPPLVIPVAPPVGASLSQPFGTVRPPQPSGNPADFASLLPNVAGLIGGQNDFPFGTYDIHNQLPYTENFSLDMQWQPFNSLAVTLGYNGNRGRHQILPIPFNQAQLATPQHPINGQIYSYGYQPLRANGTALSTEPLNTFNGGNVDLRVPFIGYSPNAVAYEARGVSAYDGLVFNVQKRITHGLQAGFSYTWSHSLDESSALGLFYNGNNPANPRDSYASSDFDRTHVITFNYVYQVPDFKPPSSFLGKVVDGWGLSGITVLQSGQPYSVVDFSGSIASVYYSFNDSITNPIVPLAPGFTPQQALTGHSGAYPGFPALNASAFSIPVIAPGTGGVPPCDADGFCDNFETGFGRGGRNIFRQPFQKRADVSLFKVLPITERFRLRYDLQAFNVTNTPTFDAPGNTVFINQGFSTNAPNFVLPPGGLGRVVRTLGSPREVQMALHLTF